MTGDSYRPLGGDSIAVLGGEDARHASRANCFADEVIVDFPSVAPAVERMRSAFVDETRTPLVRADVRLTPQQAICGARVPLDVPVRVTCRRCGGRGESWAEACARCAGTGSEILQHQVQVSVPAGVLDGTSFRFSVATRQDPPTRVELRVAVR